MKIVETKIQIDEYPDQINISVQTEFENGDMWFVQTNDDGRYSPFDNCECWFNENNDLDVTEIQGFDLAIENTEKVAEKTLSELKQKIELSHGYC